MIKTILFDIDGVLIDSVEANQKFLNDVLVKAGYGGMPDATDKGEYHRKWFYKTMMDIIKEVTKSSSEKELQRVWDIGNTREVPYPLHLLRMPDDVPATIQKLAKKYTLGLVTSRIKNAIYEFSKLAALQKYFSLDVAYEDTTNHKPHPEPLLFAAKQLGMKPQECVYVGDLETDVQAAKAAGMKSVIVSKDKFDNADGYTKTMAGLPHLLNRFDG